MAAVGNPPSVIESKGLCFLVFDSPKDSNLPTYIEEFKKHNVRHVVRVCEPTYDPAPLLAAGIQFYEMPYDDGSPPPPAVIKRWLSVVKQAKNEKSAIGVHCVAGLGRAPVLVAIALIESGETPLLAVDFIRKARRGAINKVQLDYLRKYKKSGGCVIQ